MQTVEDSTISARYSEPNCSGAKTRGDVHITPAEERVLRALASDPYARQKAIADSVGSSTRTIEHHLGSLRKKLREPRTPRLVDAWRHHRRMVAFADDAGDAAERIARAERAFAEIVTGLDDDIGAVASIEIDRASGAPRVRIYLEEPGARGDER
jgi:DNA-binding CsgD family transcriptional regulator